MTMNGWGRTLRVLASSPQPAAAAAAAGFRHPALSVSEWRFISFIEINLTSEGPTDLTTNRS